MLKKRFFAGNGPRMYELEGTIRNCKQQGDYVIDYFGKLTKMWDKLVITRKLQIIVARISLANRSLTVNANMRRKGSTNSYSI